MIAMALNLFLNIFIKLNLLQCTTQIAKESQFSYINATGPVGKKNLSRFRYVVTKPLFKAFVSAFVACFFEKLSMIIKLDRSLKNRRVTSFI